MELRKVLAIGAHPDDLELGCGATLARLTADGVHVRAMILTRGARGCEGDHDRSLETKTALGLLGVHDIIQCNFPDTQLHTALNEIIHAINVQVSDLCPERVYTMFREDRHQDHRAVHEASVVACREVPQLLGYETPSSQPTFTPALWESVDEQYLAAKVAALKAHHSQTHRRYMQERVVRAAAVFRGYQVNGEFCEAFIPYRLVFWN